MLISGNIPFDTQVASVFVFKQIESDNPGGAAAVSVVLLLLSLLVLHRDPLALGALGERGMTVDRPARIGLRVVALGYLALLLLIPVGVVFYRTFEHGHRRRSGTRSRRRRRSTRFSLTLEVALIAVPLNAVFGVAGGARARARPRSAASGCSTR